MTGIYMRWMKTALLASIWVWSSIHFLYGVDISLTLPNATMQEVNGKALPTVGVGEFFRIQVRVSGGNRDTGNVTIDHMENITVQGQSSATNITVVNGNFNSEKIYTYDVVVNQKGVYTFGPAKIVQNNTPVSSQPLTFQVADAVSKPSSSATQQSAQQPGNAQQPENDYKVFAKFRVDKSEAVVGETVEATLQIFLKGNIVDLSIEPLTATGVTINEVGEPIKRREVVDGVDYTVYEKRFLITALDKGIKELGPVSLVYNVQEFSRKQNNKRGGFFSEDFFDHFFRMPRVVQRKAHSEKVSFTVRELPPSQDRVDGIGDFTSFTMSANQGQVHVNEPITLRLELVGRGNLDQIPDPVLNLPSDVRSYKSKTSVQREAQASILNGKKIFEYVLQPKKIGVLRIPSQSFAFYSSTQGHKVLHTNEIAVTVNPAREGDAPLAGPQQSFEADEKSSQSKLPKTDATLEKPLTLEDIHFIGEDVAVDKKHAPALPLWLYLLIIIFLSIAISYSHVNGWWTKQFSSWFVQRERGKQFYVLTKELETLVAHNNAHGLYQLFLRLLSFKYHYPLHELTEQIIEQVLIKKGFDESKAQEFVHYLQKCASLTFSSSQYNASQQEELLKRANYWFLMLNK